MATRRKKKRGSPMPAQSAGLLRFFEEETEGIKMRPELLVVFTVGLIIVAIIAQLQAAGMLKLG
jgi:preprotein translocase subunit Sec61beta